MLSSFGFDFFFFYNFFSGSQSVDGVMNNGIHGAGVSSRWILSPVDASYACIPSVYIGARVSFHGMTDRSSRSWSARGTLGECVCMCVCVCVCVVHACIPGKYVYTCTVSVHIHWTILRASPEIHGCRGKGRERGLAPAVIFDQVCYSVLFALPQAPDPRS